MTTNTPPPNGFNLPILHKIYDLYKLFYQYSQNFPKQDRYTIGSKCDHLILEMLELIIFATQTSGKEKLPFLKNTSIKLNVLRITLRLAKDIKTIDLKKYLALQQNIDEIGKMLGGWIKSLT